MKIMIDSPEAASIQTVTGWVSRDGFFFGNDERTARYAGCTHRACEKCGSVIEKNRIVCDVCNRKRLAERFAKMPRQKWDGETPLVIFDSDKYFFTIEDIDEYCEDQGCEISDLRLIICKPVKPGPLSAGDLFFDELPEDGDVQDPDVLAAVDALNKALAKAEPFSWREGDTVAIVEPQGETK